MSNSTTSAVPTATGAIAAITPAHSGATGRRYPLLFSPLRIGARVAKNRIMNAPHSTLIGAGQYSDALIDYMEERAKGGAALIVSQSSYVTADYGDLKIHSDAALPALLEAARRIQQRGALLVVQLLHPGAQGNYNGDGPELAVAPSQVPLRYLGQLWRVPRVLTGDEIERIKASYIEAALRVFRAGADGIELHAAHGNLVEQFLSPRSNLRTDEWGGDWPRRARFAREILAGIRAATSPEFIIGVRVTGGVTGNAQQSVEKLAAVAALLDAAPVDYVSVSMGNYSSGNGFAANIPDASETPGAWAAHARAVRAIARVPVFVSGRIQTARLAEQLLAEGDCDGVAMARALVADPYLPLKAEQGREAQTRPCVGIQDGCWGRVMSGKAMRCAFNPRAGLESVYPAEPVRAGQPREVLVVGGGPAGLQFAVAAAQRGHRVRLVEAAAQPGGQLALASRTPGRGELAEAIDWLVRECERLGVEIETNRRLSADELANTQSVVAIATGARARHLLDANGNALSLDVRDTLRAQAVPGKRVVIFDEAGSRQAIDVAEWLAERGHEVRLATSQTYVGQGLDETVRVPAAQRLARRRIRMRAELAWVTGGDGRAVFEDRLSGEQVVWEGVDTIVSSLVPLSSSELVDALRVASRPFFLIGDAASPRGVADATRDAWLAAQSIG